METPAFGLAFFLFEVNVTSQIGHGVGYLFCRGKGVWAQRVLFPRRKGTPRRAQPLV